MILAQQYFLLVFSGSLGVIQLAALYGNLEGLHFFKSKITCFFIGMFLIFIAFFLFFKTGERNISDTAGGLAGSQQFALFLLGSFSSITLTFVVTSFVNVKRHFSPIDINGLSSLRETTFFNVLLCKMRSNGYFK